VCGKGAALARLSACVLLLALRVLESKQRALPPRSRRAASLKTRLLCSFLLRHSELQRRAQGCSSRPAGGEGKGGARNGLERSEWLAQLRRPWPGREDEG
jgi:hypothetical protein